ncbi:hypothetical protein ACS0TY_006557 [Phlomoides rotata]
METLSGPVLSFSGSKILPNGAVYSKMPFRFHRRDTNRFSKFHFQTAVASRRLTQNQSFQMLYLHNRSSATTHISSAGRNYELNYDDDSRTKPFWLNMIQEAIWNTRSLLLFIAEQPSQLKYIEWPSFQSTVSLLYSSNTHTHFICICVYARFGFMFI